jgi:hypothetical protein
MSKNIISEYYSDDNIKKAIVYEDDNHMYCVDFYDDKRYSCTVQYPEKSLRYAEDAAENYVIGLFGRHFFRKLNDI